VLERKMKKRKRRGSGGSMEEGRVSSSRWRRDTQVER
jgi:hypothetical protein